MEKALLTSGHILAGLLVLVAVLVLVALVAGVTFVQAAATIPATVTRTLAEEDFFAQAAQAALISVLNSLPEEIVAVGAAIRNTAVLIDGLRNADFAEVARQIVPREWLQQQLITALTQSRQNAGDGSETGLVRAALLGEAGHNVARLVVTAARECSDREVGLLERLRPSESETSLIGFICNPPTLPDVDLGAVMQDVIVVSLAGVADQLAENIPNPLDDLDLEQVGVDTPIGRLSLEWPALQLDTGAIDLTIPLPENVQQSVETSVTQMQSAVQAVSDQLNARVAESRNDLETLGSDIALSQTPEDQPTEPQVEATRPAIEATITNALADLQARITSSVEATLQTLNTRLTELAASVNQILILVGGGLLVLLTIAVLYLVRTLKGVGLWIGLVLLSSGIVIILFNGQLSANWAVNYSAQTNLSETAMQLRTILADAVSAAVRNELTSPMLSNGILLSLIGGALLGYLFYASRRSTPSSQESAIDNQEQPV